MKHKNKETSDNPLIQVCLQTQRGRIKECSIISAALDTTGSSNQLVLHIVKYKKSILVACCWLRHLARSLGCGLHFGGFGG